MIRSRSALRRWPLDRRVEPPAAISHARRLTIVAAGNADRDSNKMRDGRIARSGMPDKERNDVTIVIGRVKPDVAVRPAGSKPLDTKRNADSRGDQIQDGAALPSFAG